MLWTKSWLETRWRFLIGLAIAICSTVASVHFYPQVAQLLNIAPTNVGGQLGARIREAVDYARTFNGYVWAQWLRQNFSHLVIVFAVLLGTTGFISETSGALFTLSLPVSRKHLANVRAITGLAELFAITFVPAFLLVMIAPTIGQHYPLANAIVFSLCIFVGATVFFALAFLLSTFFNDPWRPLMIALMFALVLTMIDFALPTQRWTLYRIMDGGSYFFNGQIPWGGLLLTAVISALIYAGAVTNLKRRDF